MNQFSSFTACLPDLGTDDLSGYHVSLSPRFTSSFDMSLFYLSYSISSAFLPPQPHPSLHQSQRKRASNSNTITERADSYTSSNPSVEAQHFWTTTTTDSKTSTLSTAQPSLHFQRNSQMEMNHRETHSIVTTVTAHSPMSQGQQGLPIQATVWAARLEITTTTAFPTYT